jgi:hypothetical protein
MFSHAAFSWEMSRAAPVEVEEEAEISCAKEATAVVHQIQPFNLELEQIQRRGFSATQRKGRRNVRRPG